MYQLISNIRLSTFIISWLASIISIILSDSIIVDIGVYSFSIFFLLTLPFLRKQSFIIVIILISLCCFLFNKSPSYDEIFLGIRYTLIFAGLIPTMGLVRAAAIRLESVKKTQDLLVKLPSDISSSGFQITGHLSGSVINTGVFAILAAAIPENSNNKYRQKVAEASIRGMASSATWSPFFFAFAVGQVYVDISSSWIGLSLGLITSIFFTSLSLLFINSNLSISKLKISINCLQPVFIHLSIIMTLVISMALLFKLTALSAVIIVMPILVFLQCFFNPSVIKLITNDTFFSMKNNIDDVIIISFAMLIGYFATQSDISDLSLINTSLKFMPVWMVLIFIPLSMTAISLFGIHPVITSTLLLPVFTSEIFEINLALIMQAHLIGWCAGTMSSIASLSVITCSNLFRIPSFKLAFGINIYIAILFSLLGGFLLILLNWIFFS